MIDHIIWPTESADEEDKVYPLETRAKVGMFLQQFIETGMPYAHQPHEREGCHDAAQGTAAEGRPQRLHPLL